MVRLDGPPSPSCSSRNRSRLLASRNKEDDSSKSQSFLTGVAVKQYWSTLASDEKLAILRFQNRILVDELYDIQQSLYTADMQCYTHGFRGQDIVRSKAGIAFFDIEGVFDGNGSLCPRAFIAHRSFVEMDDMFEFLEERLERPFLQEQPHLEEKHWASLLKPRPTSWVGFVHVCLRLVELALLKSQQESIRNTTCESGLPKSRPETMSNHLCESTSPCAVVSQCAKRKARKKRILSGLAAAAESDEALRAEETLHHSSQQGVVCPSDHVESPMASPPEIKQSTSTLNESSACTIPIDDDSHVVAEACDDERAGCALPFLGQTAQDASSSANDVLLFSSPAIRPHRNQSRSQLDEAADQPNSMIGHSSSDMCDTYPLLSDSQSLRQSAREARVSAVVSPVLIASQASRACACEAWVSAEFRMRQGRGRTGHPWLLADGSSGENWVDGFRATVKNTFLEVEKMEPESSALRSQSWPCWRGGGA